MTLKELDRLAKLNEPMPKLLEYYEENYYISSRYLYRQFELNKITVEQARIEKDKIVKSYNDNKEMYEYVLSLYSIRNSLMQLKEQGFNSILEWEVLDTINKALKGANNG